MSLFREDRIQFVPVVFDLIDHPLFHRWSPEGFKLYIWLRRHVWRDSLRAPREVRPFHEQGFLAAYATKELIARDCMTISSRSLGDIFKELRELGACRTQNTGRGYVFLLGEWRRWTSAETGQEVYAEGWYLDLQVGEEPGVLGPSPAPVEDLPADKQNLRVSSADTAPEIGRLRASDRHGLRGRSAKPSPTNREHTGPTTEEERKKAGTTTRTTINGSGRYRTGSSWSMPALSGKDGEEGALGWRDGDREMGSPEWAGRERKRDAAERPGGKGEGGSRERPGGKGEGGSREWQGGNGERKGPGRLEVGGEGARPGSRSGVVRGGPRGGTVEVDSPGLPRDGVGDMAEVFAIYEAANGRPATALEKDLLTAMSRELDATGGGPGGKAVGSDWLIAAIVEAVSSGSSFVAPRRIEEICDRWRREGFRSAGRPESPGNGSGGAGARRFAEDEDGRQLRRARGAEGGRGERRPALAGDSGVPREVVLEAGAPAARGMVAEEESPVPAKAVVEAGSLAEAGRAAAEEDCSVPKRIGGEASAVDQAIWGQALALLRRQLTRANFETWLGGSVLRGREGDTFVVAVENAVICDWIEKRLRGHICRALGEVVGRSVDLRCVVKRPEDPGADVGARDDGRATKDPPGQGG